MRFPVLFAALLLLVPDEALSAQPAVSDGITVTSSVVQKGFFKDTDCEENIIKPGAPCLCEADIDAPIVSNAEYPEKADSLTSYFHRRAEELQCLGEPIDATPRSEQRVSHFEVTFAGASVLSVLTTNYTYLGGAHGRTTLDAVIYDMVHNRPVTADILFGREHEPYVNDAIYTALMALPQGTIATGQVEERKGKFIVKGKCDKCHLVLLPKGVKIMFDQYAVGPYSSGNISVTLPKELITNKEILKELVDKK